jgi:hypothetical protein
VDFGIVMNSQVTCNLGSPVVARKVNSAAVP